MLQKIHAKHIVIDGEFAAPTIAAASLGGWYLFFGAAGPQPALAGQHLALGHLYPEHGLYFLTCIGVYFVIAECILFRSVEPLLRPAPSSIAIALLMSILFWFSPPIENVVIVPTMGHFDIAMRAVLSAPARMILYWAPAVVACLRFRPSSLGGLMLYANAIIMTGAHLAWDKYTLPLLAVLWLLKSADRLDMKSASAPETSAFAMAK